jgi:hypothetical protein
MALSLKRFDPRSIQFRVEDAKAPVIVMIGKRDTGKSFLIRDLLYYHQDIPVGTVISGTESGNGFYGKMVPKLFIHDVYESVLIEKVLQRQKLALKQYKHNMETYKKSSLDPRTFVILDDCLYDDKWSRDKLMRCIFLNGRHWKIMLILSMQYPLGIPPLLRSNIDYVFILRENILSNRKRIWENYAGMFPTFESFCSVMDQTTENFECLVIHNGSKSNKIQDQIFWYKAESRPDFKLGSKQFWEMSAQVAGDSDSDDEYDPNSSKKRKSANITVKKSKW